MLCLEVKHAIFFLFGEKRESCQIKLASELEISKQQVNNILKNRENVKHFPNNFKTSNGLQRKLLKSAKNKESDRCVHSRTFEG